MNKKVFAILSLALVAIVCAGTVCAFDLGSLTGSGSDENETVTIDGIDFNIPAGFEEDTAHEIVNQEDSRSGIDYITNGKLYEKDDDIFVLLVATYDGYEVTDEIVEIMGGEKQTYNDVDGYLTEDEDYKVFSYAKDGKLVAISTNNADIFSDVIIK